ncbi:MAG: hypothetical protein KAT11_02125 [Phycisphaerae bacterium]|nr:hypothetical protein [Phycisphaerae bacterium]
MRQNVLNWLVGDGEKHLCTNALLLLGNPYLFQKEVFFQQFDEVEQVGLFHNAVVNGKKVTFIEPLFGAPMTAMYVEILADMEVQNIIACGYVGGISSTARIGSYGLVTEARGLDGTTQAYSPSRSTFSASDLLVKKLQQQLTQRSLAYQAGSIASIDALLLEDDRMIQNFRDAGHCFVDLETSCLFALGTLRKFQAAALHIVTDNPTNKTIDSGYEHEACFTEQIQMALDVLTSLD